MSTHLDSLRLFQAEAKMPHSLATPPPEGNQRGKEHVGGVKVMGARLCDEPWGVN